MKKKVYISPITEAISIAPVSIICGSIMGIAETGDLDTLLDNDDTETVMEYLSRESEDRFFE